MVHAAARSASWGGTATPTQVRLPYDRRDASSSRGRAMYLSLARAGDGRARGRLLTQRLLTSSRVSRTPTYSLDPGAPPRTTAGDHRVSASHTTRPIHRPARSALRRGTFRDLPGHLVRHAAVLAGCNRWAELADRGGLWIAPLPARRPVPVGQEGAPARPNDSRARIPAALCPGSWRHLRCPGGRRIRSRLDHRGLGPRGSRRRTPNAARRHRLLPRLQDVLPALVGAVAVRPTIRLRRSDSQAARSAFAQGVAPFEAGRPGRKTASALLKRGQHFFSAPDPSDAREERRNRVGVFGRLARGHRVFDEYLLVAPLEGIAGRALDADAGRDPAQDDCVDTSAAELQVQLGAVEGAPLAFRDEDVGGLPSKLRDYLRPIGRE